MEFPRKIRLSLVVLALIVAIGATASLSSSTETAGLHLTTIEPPRGAGLCANATLTDPLTATVSVTIAADSYYYTYGLCSANLGLYGDLDVDGELQIKFFICDRANFKLWTDGYSASVYLQNAGVSSLEWTFKVPKTDTWYIIYVNEYLYDSVNLAGHYYLDTTPPAIEWNIDNGAACSGIKDIAAAVTEATFDIASVRLYVDGYLVDTEYDGFFTYSWNTANASDGSHTIRIEAEDTVANMAYLSVQVTVNNAGPYLPLITSAGIPLIISGAIGVFGLTAAFLVFGRHSQAHIETSAAPVQYPPYRPELVSRSPPQLKYCLYCGAPLPLVNARFCPECGTPVSQQ